MSEPQLPAFRPELELAIELARRAGAELLRFYGQAPEVSLKSDATPVTAADLAADRLIQAGLRAHFPHPVLSEESADDKARLASEYVWIVDPLDGTRSFVKGEPTFGVLIGLTRRNRPVLGAVYMPATGKLFFAESGKGAYLDGGRGIERIRTSSLSEPKEMRVFVSKELAAAPEPLYEFGLRNVDRIGGFAAKAMEIAAGTADLYLNIDPKGSEWDTCAPEIVVAEAGGRLTDAFGRELLYNQMDVRRLGGDIVANSSEVLERVVRELMPKLSEEHVLLS